jgi:hypothetical protein
LTTAATAVAASPVVRTTKGALVRPIERGQNLKSADFLALSPGLVHSELWQLASSCTNVNAPLETESEGWSEIALGWKALGVPACFVDLESIGKRATTNAVGVAGLAVEGDRYVWLARYFDLVGKVWRKSGITKGHASTLVPDQHAKLRNFGELRRDGGVSDRVKRIALEIGLDFAGQLVDRSLVEALTTRDLQSGLAALADATDGA